MCWDMSETYRETGLWSRSLGAASGDPPSTDGIARLQSSYSIFRNRASALTERIAQALPHLTIHDVTHLDALWETADIIAGPDYPLNPIEGFVLGGAILVHDAALCFEAYEGGNDGLRGTVEWKDSYAVEKERNPLGQDSELCASADFAALRTLHAKQASTLPERAWKAPNGGSIFLIDDYELRTRYGALIGQIAASHHWPIEHVFSRLPAQVNALSTFPRNWRVDPAKVACLLRCADAAHIDSRRAPDFVYALARRQGLSADHWRAQNWLARVDVDQADSSGTSLLFTSNHGFGEGDAGAWWVAYDAVCLVDAEIRDANIVLNSRPQKGISPPFKIQRVSGASLPEVMSKHIRVDGWQPCSAKIHVGNVEALVHRLGGTNLYGENDHLLTRIMQRV
jgi:hypothetical protein